MTEHEKSETESIASLYDGIEDLSINHNSHVQEVSFCTVCFKKSLGFMFFRKKTAITMCLLCDVYLCERCSDKHTCPRYHWTKPDEISAEMIVDKMLSENNRDEQFYKKEVCVLDRVQVASYLDKWLCDISGICGLGDLHWIACDSRNYCIKIFNWKNNTLKRYIRFKSKPYDVIEIKTGSNDDLEFQGKEEINPETSLNKEVNLLNPIAITFPTERTVLILKVGDGQITKKKEFKTKHHCFSIEFCDDQIFIICKEETATDTNQMFVICVKSLDGETLKVINTNVSTLFPPYLKVHEKDIYVTDNWNHKILKIDDKGSVIKERKLEGFGPRGIAIDALNNLYVAGHWFGQIYTLDTELEQYNLLGLQTTVNLEKAWALCFHKEKLIVGHWTSQLENFVTIIGLL